jgi:pimeloyl-ACP methyl ester carboxylesterase
MLEPIVEEFPVRLTSAEAVLHVPEQVKALVIFGNEIELETERDEVAHALELDRFATLRVFGRPGAASPSTRDLCQRLVDAIDRAGGWSQTQNLPIGCFGDDRGADACLLAAAQRPERVKAIISCGPRPDRLELELSRVRAPTQIVAGSDDDALIRMNRRALKSFGAPVEIRIIPGSVHPLDREAGLQLARMAPRWFDQFLVLHPEAGESPEKRGIPPGYWPAG